MAFGIKLRAARRRAGLSQAELARRAGLNAFSIAKLEQGTREPTWATVQALVKALGVSPTAFMESTGRRS